MLKGGSPSCIESLQTRKRWKKKGVKGGRRFADDKNRGPIRNSFSGGEEGKNSRESPKEKDKSHLPLRLGGP